MSALPRLAVTSGDPAGVGPEILEAALRNPEMAAAAEWIVLETPGNFSPGAPSVASARAAFDALERAAAMAISGEVQGVVTAPVCKEFLQQVGFHFPGQTEFFAERAGVEDFAMLLTGGTLAVCLVTCHIPLAEVPAALTEDLICRRGRLLCEYLRSLGLARPRIAVAGLNPHAGENGLMGNEEAQLIRPAIERMRQELPKETEISGPHSPDTVFFQAAQGNYDAVLCMYHDQGLIPLKLHAFHEGVNVTLGLPFIRTSPDHGTAFDLAGTGRANSSSMECAMRLAARLAGQKRFSSSSNSE